MSVNPKSPPPQSWWKHDRPIYTQHCWELMKSVGSHGNLSLHSLWWRRWSSDTLWATLIRLWLHSLSCYLQICGGFLCNFIDMFSQLSCAVRTTENSWTFGSTDSTSRTPQCLCDSNSRRNAQTLVCWQFKAYTSGWEWWWGYVQNRGSRMSVPSEAPKVGGDSSGLISFIVLHIVFLNLVPWNLQSPLNLVKGHTHKRTCRNM
jgi:hypothetical protein